MKYAGAYLCQACASQITKHRLAMLDVFTVRAIACLRRFIRNLHCDRYPELTHSMWHGTTLRLLATCGIVESSQHYTNGNLDEIAAVLTRLIRVIMSAAQSGLLDSDLNLVEKAGFFDLCLSSLSEKEVNVISEIPFIVPCGRGVVVDDVSFCLEEDLFDRATVLDFALDRKGCVDVLGQRSRNMFEIMEAYYPQTPLPFDKFPLVCPPKQLRINRESVSVLRNRNLVRVTVGIYRPDFHQKSYLVVV